jgi:hypothetical protein
MRSALGVQFVGATATLLAAFAPLVAAPARADASGGARPAADTPPCVVDIGPATFTGNPAAQTPLGGTPLSLAVSADMATTDLSVTCANGNPTEPHHVNVAVGGANPGTIQAYTLTNSGTATCNESVAPCPSGHTVGPGFTNPVAVSARGASVIVTVPVYVTPPPAKRVHVLTFAGADLGPWTLSAQVTTATVAGPATTLDVVTTQGIVPPAEPQEVSAEPTGRRTEGLRPLVLPSNYTALTDAAQQFVVTNLERTARGIAPFKAISPALDANALTAAEHTRDPNTPAGAGWSQSGGGAYPHGSPTPLLAIHGYIYTDGVGDNGSCHAITTPGCWDHRSSLLGSDGHIVDGSYLLATTDFGAAYSASGNSAWDSATATNPTVAKGATFTWAQELADMPACEKPLGDTCAGTPAILALTFTGRVYGTVPPATPPSGPPAPKGNVLSSPVVGMAATPTGNGYWLTTARGAVEDFGTAAFYGSMLDHSLNAPISHIVATPTGGGYWLVAQDGGTFSFGDAYFYGSMGGKPLNAPVVGMAPTPTGKGYWLVAADGGVFSFGAARFSGSMGSKSLNAPVVGIAADPSTGGYWEVATDGGIFSFGAPFFGSTGSLHLNAPVNGMSVMPSGTGYRFVASDGGIFSFGAPFYGSMGGQPLPAPIMGMAEDTATGGYWLIGAGGGVYAFHAPFLGAG